MPHKINAETHYSTEHLHHINTLYHQDTDLSDEKTLSSHHNKRPMDILRECA